MGEKKVIAYKAFDYSELKQRNHNTEDKVLAKKIKLLKHWFGVLRKYFTNT